LEGQLQRDMIALMTAMELKDLQGRNYLATQEELRIIDDAMAAIDGGEVATDIEIKAAFAKFRSA
jgi:hypothetical protein